MRRTASSRALEALAGLLLGLLLTAGAARPAAAQQPPCVLDKCLGIKRPPLVRPGDAGGTPPRQPPATEDAGPTAGPAAGEGTDAGTGDPGSEDGGFGGRRSGQGRAAGADFDFYVLALSWSPGFCATGGSDRSPDQCAPGRGLGFVVHGLWPQYVHGFPSDCDSGNRMVPRQVLEAIRGLYPDVGLARHEWAKHGTCSGKSPSGYFADVRAARDAVTLPRSLTPPVEDQTAAPIDILRAFTAANPGLRSDMMAVACRSGVLEEVRICFSRDLRRFVSCPEVSRGACRTRSIRIPGSS